MIDERRGRTEARLRGLATAGTLGVLPAAGERGLVDAPAYYDRFMRETNFRATQRLQEDFLRQLRNRDRKPTVD